LSRRATSEREKDEPSQSGIHPTDSEDEDGEEDIEQPTDVPKVCIKYEPDRPRKILTGRITSKISHGIFE